MSMMDLYLSCCDERIDLDKRYHLLKIMLVKQQEDPRDYVKLHQKALRQRAYNEKRIDWRVQA